MASSTKSPSAATQFDNSGGTTWDTVSTTNSEVTLPLGAESDFLAVSGFSFEIPENAIITNIIVDAIYLDSIISSECYLVKDATTSSGGTKSSQKIISSGSFSGSLSSWGISDWTISDFNTSTFGLFFNFGSNTFINGYTASVNTLRIAIVYSEPGGSRVQFIGI